MKLKTLSFEVGKIDKRDFRVNRVEIWVIQLLQEVIILSPSDKICQIIKYYKAFIRRDISTFWLLHTTPNGFLLMVTWRVWKLLKLFLSSSVISSSWLKSESWWTFIYHFFYISIFWGKCQRWERNRRWWLPFKGLSPRWSKKKKSKAQTSWTVSTNSLSVSTITCTARHIPYLIFTFTAPREAETPQMQLKDRVHLR